MPTTIDERVLMLAVMIALVVFAILNIVESQKATPNVSTLQSYSVLLIVLAGTLFLLAL
jgi:Na+/serine symporter